MGKPTMDSESSISHFSHVHPLQLLNNQSLQALTHVSCSGCHLEASDQSVYGCIACNYFLHKKCSQMPQKISHPFDQHCFSLLPKPKYSEGVFNCDGCGKQGGGFCYHCETCGKDLHILCASLPMILTHQSHHHQLSLTFSPPYHNKTFNCDLCKNAGSNNWLYRCNTCEFDVHLSCVTTISSAPRTRSTLPTPSPNPLMMNSTLGFGQAQAQVIGMPYTTRPQMMNTMPPNNFMNSANTAVYGSATPISQQQAFAQQYASAQQQAFAQQQVFAQQHALAQQQALAQRQAIMQQQTLAQQQAIMQQQALAQQPGNMLMNSFVQGLAGGVAQGATEALIQGLVGGNGGNGGGGVAFLGFGGTDGSAYDGSFGGMDGGGGGGGDGSY